MDFIFTIPLQITKPFSVLQRFRLLVGLRLRDFSQWIIFSRIIAYCSTKQILDRSAEEKRWAVKLISASCIRSGCQNTARHKTAGTLSNLSDAERRGFKSGISEMGKEGREFISTEIAPLGIPVFLGP